MLRKCLFISAALLLCLATSASARVYWTDGGLDHLWSNAENWGDYTDPDPCIPGHEGTLAPLGREPNASDGTIFIGQGNGLDAGTNYPPQLYALAASKLMVDPTIDSNTTTTIGNGFWGGAFSSATYNDPNRHHQLWITPAGKLSTAELKMPIGTGGSMTIYNSGELNPTFFNLSRSGGSQGYYYGEPGSYLMLNVELRCPPQNNPDQAGFVSLDNAIAHVKRVCFGGDDGTIDLENGGKLTVRMKNHNFGWVHAPEWIADGRITAHGGYVHGELMAGDPLLRAIIVTSEEPNAVDSNYPGLNGIYKLSGDNGPDLEITSAMIDAYQAYDPIPPDGAGTAGTPLSAFSGLRWTPGYNVAAAASQLFYYDANDGSGLVLKATFNADVNTIDPYVLGYGLSGENSYWRVDEVNSVGGTTVGEVWSYRVDAGPATNLVPEDEAGNVYPEQTLTWTAGFLSTASRVYLSTVSWEDVNDRTAAIAYEGPNTWLDLGELTLDETYYWCVDAVGSVLIKYEDPIEFTTDSTILIDDFDDYADDTELRDVWTSGLYGNNESTIWNNTTTAVDGNSLQLDYVCYGKYSETTAAMSYRDDAYSISAWVYGAAANNSAPVYLGAAVGATVDVQVQAGVDVTVEEWQECRVAFSDLALTSADIDTVIIGVGNRTTPGNEGMGSIYVDEVRLYPRRCLAPDVIPADFSADCLVGYDDVDILAQRWLVAKTAPTAPTAPLSLYLPFDEGEGNTVAHDLSGRGLDMPALGPVIWEPTGGVVGGAAKSGGMDARFYILDDWPPAPTGTGGTNRTARDIFQPSVDNNSNLTVMFYMKYGAGEAARRSFVFASSAWNDITELERYNPVTFRDTSGGGGFACWMGLGWEEDGEAPKYGYEHTFDPTFVDQLGPGADVAEEIKGIWYHFAMVKDADNGVGRIYEDGVQIADWDDATLDANSMSMPVDYIYEFGVLGCADSGWGSSVNSSLDEFRIYPEALNEAEIKYLIDPGDTDPFFPNSAEPLNLYNADDIINFKDYSDFANFWLDDQLWPDELP